jgi:AraC-like DNA-binding protein
MAHNDRIAKAIADLKTQDRPNIAATAKRYKVARTTLLDRFQGKTGTNEDVNSYVRQQLIAT